MFRLTHSILYLDANIRTTAEADVRRMIDESPVSTLDPISYALHERFEGCSSNLRIPAASDNVYERILLMIIFILTLTNFELKIDKISSRNGEHI